MPEPIDSLRAGVGYRSCGRVRGGWLALFLPHLGQVWTSPFAPAGRAREALPEEFVHESWARGRAAQLYPLVQFLTGDGSLPGVREFRDIVESLYLASLPLINDSPVGPQSVLLDSPEADLAREMLVLAQRLAQRSDSQNHQNSARDALWVLGVILSYIVPALPGQGRTVLQLIATAPELPCWSTGGQLYQHLFAHIVTALRSQPEGTYAFTIVAPREMHRDLGVMLRLLALAVTSPAESVLAATPAILHMITLQRLAFVPLVRFRKTPQLVRASVELFLLSPEPEAASSRPPSDVLTHSGDADACPALRFHDLCVRMVTAVALPRTPIRPGTVFAAAVEAARVGYDQFLGDLINSRPVGCERCGAIDRKGLWATDMHILLSAPKKVLDGVRRLLDSYEEWTVVGAIPMYGQLLGMMLGPRLPPVRITPYRIDGRIVPVLWRYGASIL